MVIDNLDIAKIAASTILRTTRRYYEWDELLSSAYFGLCRAAKLFKGGKFAAYAQTICERQIKSDIARNIVIPYPLYLMKPSSLKYHATSVARYRADALRAQGAVGTSLEVFDLLEWRR